MNIRPAHVLGEIADRIASFIVVPVQITRLLVTCPAADGYYVLDISEHTGTFVAVPRGNEPYISFTEPLDMSFQNSAIWPGIWKQVVENYADLMPLNLAVTDNAIEVVCHPHHYYDVRASISDQ